MTVIATGSSPQQDRWELVIDQRGEADPVTSIRVTTASGHTSQGGYGDRSIWPGQSISWYAGWDDEGGPNRVIVRVARDVYELQVRLSNGRNETLELTPHPVHNDASIAGLVYPADVTINDVFITDRDGTRRSEQVPIHLQRRDHSMPPRPQTA